MKAVKRARCLGLLMLVVPPGFATKFYSGPASTWVADSFGGLLYVLFWILLAVAILPRHSVVIIAGIVLGMTCTLEFLQLWHPAWLEPIRASFLGHALLGNTFSWSDFPYYLVGALSGIGLVRIWCEAKNQASGDGTGINR